MDEPLRVRIIRGDKTVVSKKMQKKKNEWKCNELRLTTCGVERGRIFVREENQRERERSL